MEKNYYKEYYHLERSHWWFQATRCHHRDPRDERVEGLKREAAKFEGSRNVQHVPQPGPRAPALGLDGVEGVVAGDYD